MNRVTPSILFALLLCGCAGTRYRRPDLPVPPNFRGDAQAPGLPGAANTAQTGRPRRTPVAGSDPRRGAVQADSGGVGQQLRRAHRGRASVRGARPIQRRPIGTFSLGRRPRQLQQSADRAGWQHPFAAGHSGRNRLHRPKGQLRAGNSTSGDESAMPVRLRGPTCWPASKRGGWCCKRC